MTDQHEALAKLLCETFGHKWGCNNEFSHYLDALAELPAEDRSPGDMANPCTGGCWSDQAHALAGKVQVVAKPDAP